MTSNQDKQIELLVMLGKDNGQIKADLSSLHRKVDGVDTRLRKIEGRSYSLRGVMDTIKLVIGAAIGWMTGRVIW